METCQCCPWQTLSRRKRTQLDVPRRCPDQVGHVSGLLKGPKCLESIPSVRRSDSAGLWIGEWQFGLSEDEKDVKKCVTSQRWESWIRKFLPIPELSLVHLWMELTPESFTSAHWHPAPHPQRFTEPEDFRRIISGSNLTFCCVDSLTTGQSL